MMSDNKKSTVDLLHIPKDFGVLVLTLTLILTISPYIGGVDLGVIKIPNFSQEVTSILKYLGPVLFVIAFILHLPFWQQDGNEEDRQVTKAMTDSAKEEAVCQKSEAEFQIFFRQFNNKPISETQLSEIEGQIKGTYGPYRVLHNSLDIRIEYYVLPFISELIKLETDLRIEHRVPFSKVRIEKLKEKIRTLVKENWPNLVNAAYEDAINHVSQHGDWILNYKKKELSDECAKLLTQNPKGLFDFIDELLRKAYADSVLLSKLD